MKKCNKCLLPENFPDAMIDKSGLCVYCRKRATSHDYAHEEPRFLEIIHEVAKESKFQYDCVVCYSGGKDSTYTLIKTVKKYSLRPLAFTLDNGFISQKAKENIQLICDSLEVDLLTVRPNTKQINAMFKATLSDKIFSTNVLKRLSSACYACITFVNYQAIQIAIEKGLKIIISGFTHGQVPKAVFPFKNEVLKTTFIEMKSQLSKKLGFDADNLYPQIDFSEIGEDYTLYNVNPLLFEAYDEDIMLREIKEYGWERPEDVDSCSSNCLINKVGNYYHNKFYGYHPYQYEVSALIRGGAIAKEKGREMLMDTKIDKEAMAIIEKLGLEY